MLKSGKFAYELCDNIYLNITNRCSSNCIFCKQRNSGFLKGNNLPPVGYYNNLPASEHPVMEIDDIIFGYNILDKTPIYGRDLRLSEEPSADEIINELENYNLSKYNEVVFSGLGEPMIRFDEVLAISQYLTKRSIHVRLDTIGHGKLLYPERNIAEELAKSGMKQVSISLNAHDEATYNAICRPKLENSYNSRFEFAQDVIKAKMGLCFTVIDLPIVDLNKCRQLAWHYNATFKVRPFF